MIKIEHTEIAGFSAAIRGMRNAMESWARSDSEWVLCPDDCIGAVFGHIYNVGKNDIELMRKLIKAGSDERKFMRDIVVHCDVTAMQPWWAEFDTYKIGTVRNSCSKMHKIHVKPFELSDFSHEGIDKIEYAASALYAVVGACEKLRRDFNETHDKKYWRALIELLPEGYNMRATVMLNYEVLRNMYHARKNHKLDEWHTFCDWVETLPYSELITGEA